MKISIKLITTREEIIANCPELDINCYGADKNEALRRIKNVIRFYLESAKELGLDVESFEGISVDGEIENYTREEDSDSASHTIQ